MRTTMKLMIALMIAFAILVGYVECTRADDTPASISSIELNDPMASQGFDHRTEWTGWNKFWFAGAVGGNAADVISTNDALNRGCVEANPIFGEDPDMGLIIGAKLAALGLSYWFTEYVVAPSERQNARNIVYGAHSLIMSGVAIHNFTIDCN